MWEWCKKRRQLFKEITAWVQGEASSWVTSIFSQYILTNGRHKLSVDNSLPTTVLNSFLGISEYLTINSRRIHYCVRCKTFAKTENNCFTLFGDNQLFNSQSSPLHLHYLLHSEQILKSRGHHTVDNNNINPRAWITKLWIWMPGPDWNCVWLCQSWKWSLSLSGSDWLNKTQLGQSLTEAMFLSHGWCLAVSLVQSDLIQLHKITVTCSLESKYQG